MAEPCAPWPVDEACSFGIPADPMGRTDIQVYAMDVATEWLWKLTANVYGTCPVTVRPCGRKCRGFDYFPIQTGQGTWINVACDCFESSCDCCYVCEIVLEGPVASVTEVLIDGDVVDPDTYRIDDGYKLVRTGGEECWPQCQDLSLPTTEVGTFAITYERGLAVPPGGKRAVAALAAEIIKSCEAGPCRLPSRVQQIVRQGVTMDLINDPDFLTSGLTGLTEVDAWVNLVNPNGQREQSQVWSPAARPILRITTWP